MTKRTLKQPWPDVIASIFTSISEPLEGSVVLDLSDAMSSFHTTAQLGDISFNCWCGVRVGISTAVVEVKMWNSEAFPQSAVRQAP